MKTSIFYTITTILAIQALIYTILSLGSLIDTVTYLTSNQQPDLTSLSFLALIPNSNLNILTSAWSTILALAATLTFLILAYLYGFKSELGRIWLILAIATGLWFGGEFLWFYFVVANGEIPDGVTIADFSWLLGYPFYFFGLLLLNRQIGLSIKKNQLYLYSAVLGVFSVIVLYILGTNIYTQDSLLFDSTVYYSYVIGDLIMLYLAGLIFLKFSSGAEIRKPYMLLILAFLTTALADFLYDFTSYILGIYQTYAFDFADSLYIIGYTLLTVGALTYYYLVSKVLSD